MPDLPEISDETVDAFNRASMAELLGARATPELLDEYVADCRAWRVNDRTRAGLAAALVASGWRPEADVRREVQRSLSLAGLAALRCIPDGEIRNGCVIHDGAKVRERFRQAYLAITADRATALEPAQPLPVAAVEGQERSEGPVMVPCECPDPRCTNRIAILLVGDEESDRG